MPIRRTSGKTPRTTTSPTPSSGSSTASSGPARGLARAVPDQGAAGPGDETTDRDLDPADEESLSGESRQRRATLNRLLFAGPAADFTRTRETYGDVSVLSTADYLYGLQQGGEHVIELEKGVRLIATLEAVSDADEKGMRTVMCTLNGQMRPVSVRDRSVRSEVKTAEKADPSKPGHVAAPFAGAVTVTVKEGAVVAAGDTVATIEAMKMEANITTSVGGTVERVTSDTAQQVEGGDLLLVITVG
jgi:pyruvate carboxylase